MTRTNALLVEVQRFVPPADVDLPGGPESSDDVQLKEGTLSLRLGIDYPS